MATSLRLLQSPHVLLSGKRVALTSQKPVLLLIYLAIKHDWVSRDELLGVFYPEDDEPNARHSLRVLINRAKALAWSEGLEVDTQRLRWQVPSDVLAFRETIAQKDWAKVVTLHQQPLLAGMIFDGSPGFEAWLELERETLLQTWRKAALEYAQMSARSRKHREAADVLQKVLQQDILAEDILAFYLEQAYLGGYRHEALKTYERFKATLQRELGLEPLAQTQTLASTIQRSETLPALTPQHHPDIKPIPLTVLRPPRLVAREKEQRILEQNQAPALVVWGEPGVGKTRLLQETLPTALWLRGLEGLSLPYYPLLELLRAHSTELPDLGYYRDDLARLLPELSPHQMPMPPRAHPC